MGHYIVFYLFTLFITYSAIAMQPAQWIRSAQQAIQEEEELKQKQLLRKAFSKEQSKPARETPKSAQEVVKRVIQAKSELPKEQVTDWRKILAEAEDRSRSEAIQALKSMPINEIQINDLISELADRYYDGSRLWAAWHLGTPTALNWFRSQTAKEWFKEYSKKHLDSINQNFIVSLSDKPSKIGFSLLNIGFNPNIKIHSGREYYSPLDIAFNDKNFDLFKRLLAAGADPNSMNTVKNMIIIERVALAKNIPFLKALISAGANRNPILVNGQNLIQSLEELQRDVLHSTEYDSIIDLLKTGYWQPDSLKQQTVIELAKQIKSGKLKLENAKKRIPRDLHETLENALKEDTFSIK